MKLRNTDTDLPNCIWNSHISYIKGIYKKMIS